MIVGYFVVKMDHGLGFLDYLDRLALSNQVLGVGMAVSLLGIGVGAVHWAKTLMSDEERIDYRHLQRGTDEERAEAVEMLKTGVEESGFGRRPLIRNTLIGALALFPLPGVLLFRDTGPLPGKTLTTTIWKKGDRLVLDPEGGPIKASDMVLGAVAHIMPEGIEEADHVLNEKAKAAVLLIRLEEDQLAPESLPGSYGGIVAYSKICTHMAARWLCTSSARTTCSARATSRPSTSRRTARSSSVRRSGRCPSFRSPWTTRDTWWQQRRSVSPSARATGSVHEHHQSSREGRCHDRELARRTRRGLQGRPGFLPQDLPRPLVVHAR